MGLGLAVSRSRNRPAEAKPHYERAVQLLREQIREASGAATAAAPTIGAGEGVTNVLRDLASLASTVHTLARLLEDLGPEPRQRVTCDDNSTMTSDVLAARFSAPGVAGDSGRSQFMRGRFFVV